MSQLIFFLDTWSYIRGGC